MVASGGRVVGVALYRSNEHMVFRAQNRVHELAWECPALTDVDLFGEYEDHYYLCVLERKIVFGLLNSS